MSEKKDLICLVADPMMKYAVDRLLDRHEALGSSGIRRIDYEVRDHPQRDPGCLHQAHQWLRLYLNKAEFALVLFDREGCGMEDASRDKLEALVQQRLAENGWKERAAAVVLDPELEIWVWSDSPHVATALGWPNPLSDLHSWLRREGFLTGSDIKPERPKEALQAILRTTRRRHSSALYGELARRVSLSKCADPAFSKLMSTLRGWFPFHPSAPG